MITQIFDYLKEKNTLSIIFEMEKYDIFKVVNLLHINKDKIDKLIELNKPKKVSIEFIYKPKN